jgi:hypothetical protein
MKTTTLLVFSILLAVSYINSFAQNATATIENMDACDSTEIFVPINVEDFLNVGALTIFIGFDTTGIKDISIKNINSQFQGMLFNVFYEPEPQVGLSFTSLNGANVVSGKLCDINLFYTSGTPTLIFLNGCELTTPDVVSIPVEYKNGSVSPSIDITQQPADQIVTELDETIFSIDCEGGENFQWQQSFDNGISFLDLTNSGIFSGVNLQELTIISTPGTLNNNLFRCKVFNEDCISISNDALLTVLPLMENQTVEFIKGWNGFSTYLLPVETEFETIFAPIMASIEIISDGTGIYYPSGGINTIGDFYPQKGYLIKLNTDETFNLSGYENEYPILQISPGTSYLPILSSCDITVSALFGMQMDKVEIIRELPGMNMIWPVQDINTLSNLKSGKTYLIQTLESIVITFPPCH